MAIFKQLNTKFYFELNEKSVQVLAMDLFIMHLIDQSLHAFNKFVWQILMNVIISLNFSLQVHFPFQFE